MTHRRHEVYYPLPFDLKDGILPAQCNITCPQCQSAESSRSRRRTLLDHVISVAGILPWRCGSCGTRYHARPVPLRYALSAHCGLCGNMDLQRVAFEHVPGVSGWIGRIVGVPALRCAPCRHKFLSIRPTLAITAEAGSAPPI